MAIPTSRTHEAAKLHISPELCNGCGLCEQVCKDFSIGIVDGRAQATTTSIFGCIGCGHCMAICPQEAISVSGRCLSAEDLTDLPMRGDAADYRSLKKLLQRRRSIREFKDKAVEPELIDKVLEAVRTAPMGLPPSDVHVLVFDSPEKVRKFSRDFCVYLEGLKWLVSGWFLALMRPFWGKANDALFRDFVRPLVLSYTGAMARGEDLVTYDAPVALYFYGSPLCDPADPIVAATYAMLAAESLGLGTCMLGGMHPLIQNGRAARRFREQQGIRFGSREGLIVIMGYSRVVYQKGIRRSLAAVDYYNGA
ncbi:MAG: nitroreductase family protein [Proteobacteria bacterium]|nr:nitroreductase family protein [Pseudomonadota bacterium]